MRRWLEYTGKGIKKAVIVLAGASLSLLVLLMALWFALQLSDVQTWLVGRITPIVQERLGTRVTIGGVAIRPFAMVELRDVFISDLRNDTLLQAERVSASIIGLSNGRRGLEINRVRVEHAFINLVTDTTGEMNLKALIERIAGPNDPDDTTSFAIRIRNARVAHSVFRLRDHRNDGGGPGFDPSHIRVSNLHAEVSNLRVIGDTTAMTILRLSGVDRSGLAIDDFRADFALCDQHLGFHRVRLASTGSQINLAELRFDYSSFEAFDDFLHQVRIRAQIDRSQVSTRLAAYFVPGAGLVDERLTLMGRVTGTVSDLRIRELALATGQRTSLKAQANITGLPNVSETFLMVDIRQLTTNTHDLEQLTHTSTQQPLIALPDLMGNLGVVGYSGTITGYLSKLVVTGAISTSLGGAALDASIRPAPQGAMGIRGKVNVSGFHLGLLTGSPVLGRVHLNASVDGTVGGDEQLRLTTNAHISSLWANGYQYSNVDIAGLLTHNAYEGSITVDDPNARVNFMGRVDLSDTVPVFDFSAFVPRIDLVRLNLNRVDSLSQASFLLTANFRGSNLDNSSGEIKILNAMYRNQRGEIRTSDITIRAHHAEDSKRIALTSEFADAEIRGKYSYAHIGSSLSQLMYRYLPALSPDNRQPAIAPTGVEHPEYNDYIIRLRLKQTRELTDVISPTFRIADNTNVFGIYNPDRQSLTLRVRIPEVTLSGNTIRDISIEGQTHGESFQASLTTPHLAMGSTRLGNLSIQVHAQNNQVQSTIEWDNRTELANRGAISLAAQLIRPDSLDRVTTQLNLLASTFLLNDSLWSIHPATARIDSNRVQIQGIHLSSGHQSISLAGALSPHPADSLTIALRNIDLSNANLYTQPLGYTLAGRINGYAQAANLFDTPILFADLNLQGLTLNQQPIGEMSVGCQWASESNKFSLRLLNRLNGITTIQAAGDFYPESGRMDMEVVLNELSLIYVEPILAGTASDPQGQISGTISVQGTTQRPILNGRIQVQNAGATIDFTQTRYSFSDPIHLVNSNVVFRDFRVIDPLNQQALLNGTVQTNYFSDIRMNLSLAPSNFQFLRTTERDHEMFYGNLFGTGLIELRGPPDSLSIDVTLRTDPRTAIFLPLASSHEVAESHFVSFVNPNPEIIIIEERALPRVEEGLPNLDLTLNLTITPEAELQIIINRKMGDIIRAHGAGDLKVEVNPRQNRYHIFGDYIIERGDYLFTLSGVMNKRFRIDPGSTISWGGEATDANMNIRAIYSLKTSLDQLLMVDDERYKRRTTVDCYITLTGPLLKPRIDFSINVPDVDPETRAQVLSLLNSQENIHTQFLSLLVINSFIPPQGIRTTSVGGGVGQGMANTASELLSNQLSNWLSQASSAFDIGFSYRPGDAQNQMSSNQLEVAFSTQLLNDRLTINGNVDMGAQSAHSGIAGDFNVDWKINPSGKLRLKAFARLNDEIALATTNSAQYTQGAGILFREDFNSFSDFWRRLVGVLRPQGRTPEEEEAPEGPQDRPTPDPTASSPTAGEIFQRL